MKIQTSLVYSVATVSVLIFILYLGFMTQYYDLFIYGTDELYEFYLQLQVFNKEAFAIALQIHAIGGDIDDFPIIQTTSGTIGDIISTSYNALYLSEFTPTA